MRNLSEDEDGKKDVAKATEDGTVSPIILRLTCGICLFKVWEQDFCTASMVPYVLCVTIV